MRAVGVHWFGSWENKAEALAKEIQEISP
jgi:hypothetical protein